MKHSWDDNEYDSYQAYLIRLWPTKREGVRDYWISLRNVATDDSQEFPDLKQFISFYNPKKINQLLFIPVTMSQRHPYE